MDRRIAAEKDQRVFPGQIASVVAIVGFKSVEVGRSGVLKREQIASSKKIPPGKSGKKTPLLNKRGPCVVCPDIKTDREAIPHLKGNIGHPRFFARADNCGHKLKWVPVDPGNII